MVFDFGNPPFCAGDDATGLGQGIAVKPFD